MPATVKVQKLNPTTQVIFDNVITVDHTGDEKTAVRFVLDQAGKRGRRQPPAKNP